MRSGNILLAARRDGRGTSGTAGRVSPWRTRRLKPLPGPCHYMELYMKKPVPVESASALIDEKIKELGDWRGKTLASLRKVIHDADPEIIEEWKWMGSPCWSHDGLICVANGHKDKVKLTFSQRSGEHREGKS